jgi:hypothetical protein
VSDGLNCASTNYNLFPVKFIFLQDYTNPSISCHLVCRFQNTTSFFSLSPQANQFMFQINFYFALVEKIRLHNDFQGASSIAGLYYQGLRFDVTSQPRKSTGIRTPGCTFGDIDSSRGGTGRGRSGACLRKRGLPPLQGKIENIGYSSVFMYISFVCLSLYFCRL